MVNSTDVQIILNVDLPHHIKLLSYIIQSKPCFTVEFNLSLII